MAMLTTTDRDKIQAATEAVVDTLGVPGTWAQTKSPNATKDVVVGFRTLGYADEALINAFGIGTKVLTIKAKDIAVVEKFDRFTIGTETYTIDAVMPVHLNGVHLFHKCYIRGK
jgi:hypothetical protein